MCNSLGFHPGTIFVFDSCHWYASSSNLLLYADDSCLVYQHKELWKLKKKTKWRLWEYLWLVNKLNIHFGDDKTKSIIFASKRRAKDIRKLNIRSKETNIKQQAQVTYLGCVLDKSMSGEVTALKVVNKRNRKLKLLYRKNKFLTGELSKMLCNALIQPLFVNVCPGWYPNLTKKTKNRIKLIQINVYSFVLN